MKKPFNVIITQTETQYHTYIVAAETNEEAERIVSELITDKSLSADSKLSENDPCISNLKIAGSYEITEDYCKKEYA